MTTCSSCCPPAKTVSLHDLPQSIREYHQHRNHLYSSDGVVIYKNRIVIPPSLRPACLSAAHQGTASMISKADLASHRTSKPLAQIARPATEWPHHFPPHPPSNVSVQITVTTKAAIILSSNWPIVERAKDGA